MNAVCTWKILGVACLALWGEHVVGPAKESVRPGRQSPTHALLRSFQVPGKLLTCLAFTEEGTILAGTGGLGVCRNGNGALLVGQPGSLMLISQRGEILREAKLPFWPEAIGAATEGLFYVAGSGSLLQVDAHMKPKGPIVALPMAPLPAADGEMLRRGFVVPVGAEGDVQDAEPVDFDQALRVLRDQPESAARNDWERRLAQFRRVSVLGVAATVRDVFVVCTAQRGAGADLWRYDEALQNPRKIAENLPGSGPIGLEAVGNEVFLSAPDGAIDCYDRTGRALRRWNAVEAHSGRTTGPAGLSAVRRMPDGSLCVAAPDGLLRQFSTQGKPVRTVAGIAADAGRQLLDVSPDGHQVFLLAPRRGEFRVLADRIGTPTHQPRAAIPLPVPGDPQNLRTFCLDREGYLLVGCQAAPGTGVILRLSPEGRLQATWNLDLTPQAINVAGDGSIYVGGSGRLARLTSGGQVLQSVVSPAAAEAPRPAAGNSDPKATGTNSESERKSREAEIARLTEEAKGLLRAVDAARRKYEAVYAEGDAVAIRAAHSVLDAAVAKHAQTSEVLRNLLQTPVQVELEAEASFASRQWVSGIAAWGGDVFIACPAGELRSFDLWRTDRDFGKPRKIVRGLLGWSGQLDIQAMAGEVLVAENFRHRVCRYDREGTLLGTIGSRLPAELVGFSSAFDPMNLRIAPDRTVYTSEAAWGRIKRYCPDGRLLGVVAIASIPPQVVHAPVALSPDGRQVYLLDLPRTQVLVFSR